MPTTGADPITQASRQMELMNRLVQQGQDDKSRHLADARNEELLRAQFSEKANQFVTLWADFVYNLNEKQTFDAKLARKVSKAFHDLERSEGWPVRNQAASAASSR